MNPAFVDSHSHLDLPEFDPDRQEVIERARAGGVTRIVTIGIGLPESRAAIDIAEQVPCVYAAIGLHPHNAAALDSAALHFFHDRAAHPKVVAIGEIGLDFFRNRSPRTDQIRAFRAQLEVARTVGLPVVIHDRDAHAETLEILRSERAGDVGGVIHCFSGDVRMARACIDLGMQISIPGTVTFKKARTVHEVVRAVPLEHLLIETDCPFLSPEPFRGRRNEPLRVTAVAGAIAGLKGVALEEVARATTQNASALFGLGAEDCPAAPAPDNTP